MGNIIEQSDSELIYMIRCGNFEAFQLLSFKYERIIKKYINSYIQDSYIYGFEVNDLIQECLITFYDVLFCFNENKGTFYPYVMKSIRFRLYDLIKDAMSNKSIGFNYLTTQLFRKEIKDEGPDYKGMDLYYNKDEITHPENAFVLKETTDSIFGEFSVLNEEEKRIASLRVMGYSIEEIAKMCLLNRKRIDYILKTIKKKLMSNCII